MMQQIASLKNESAATALPLDISVVENSRSEFETVLHQHQGPDAPIVEDASEMVSKTDNKVDVIHSNDSKAAKNPNNIESKTEITQESSNEQINVKHSDMAKSEKSAGHQTSTDETLPKQSEINSIVKAVNLNEQEQAYLDSLSTPKSSFDYISFVTSVADVDSLNVQQETIDANSELQATASQASKGILSLLLNSDFDEQFLDQLSQESNQTTEAIASLINFKQALKSNDIELTQENLSQLNDAIESILSEINFSTGSNSLSMQNTTAGVIENNDFDKSLVLNILSANKDLLKQVEQSTASNNTQTGDVSLSVKSINDANKTSMSKNVDSVIDSSARAAHVNIDIASKGTDHISASENTKLVSELPSSEENQQLPTPSKLNTDQTKKLSSAAMLSFSQLNEEQSEVALNNLNSRLAPVVTELNNTEKGNEFIAAMKSGIKAFKEQAKVDKELSADLKALVASAIATSGIEVDPSLQPKLEAITNQYNAVLSLTQVVNYSATQQQAQLLGLTDNQFSRELNEMQSQGSKLANNTIAQAENDKAFNILKTNGQQQLADKVRWMVSAKTTSAEIRLDPPELGAMQIKVNLNGDAAQVNFNVQSVNAKDVIDQALPRLKEMLEQQGIELGQSSVQQDNQSNQNSQQEDSSDSTLAEHNSTLNAADIHDEDSLQVIEQTITQVDDGAIDYYA